MQDPAGEKQGPGQFILFPGPSPSAFPFISAEAQGNVYPYFTAVIKFHLRFSGSPSACPPPGLRFCSYQTGGGVLGACEAPLMSCGIFTVGLPAPSLSRRWGATLLFTRRIPSFPSREALGSEGAWVDASLHRWVEPHKRNTGDSEAAGRKH